MKTEVMDQTIKINWYRSPIDKEVMRGLMQKSDWKGLRQALLHLGLFALTATASFMVFKIIDEANWIWSIPLLLLCMFCHGTVASFMGGTAGHELMHKTAFRNQKLNDFFLHIFSFISWHDEVAYRQSHVKHHQVTTHHGHDGEVILQQKLDWSALQEGDVALPEKMDRNFLMFLCWNFSPVPNFFEVAKRFKQWSNYAMGNLSRTGMFAGGEWWTQKILPEAKTDLRHRHRRWAQVVVLGHLALAIFFIATGNWFLVLLISCCGTYAGALGNICGLPQHIGMGPDVPDFRKCCRTYTCNRFIGFLYWNMQYHIEHHMYPSVPFYNLPALRKAIEHDLPPAPHGLVATWREIITILRRQRKDPSYHMIPELPQSRALG